MATSIPNSQGRYIAYSQEIDRVFFANHENIKQFKLEKVEQLLKENPFNLGNPSGIKVAQESLSSEVEIKISDFSGELFKNVRMDIASSVLTSYISRMNS